MEKKMGLTNIMPTMPRMIKNNNETIKEKIERLEFDLLSAKEEERMGWCRIDEICDLEYQLSKLYEK
jgi:hypothetical protein